MKFLILLGLITFSLMASFYAVEMERKNSIETENLNAYMNRFNDWPSKLLGTKEGDDGNGQTIYLDKHYVDCKIGALTKFVILRRKGKKIMISFQCIYPKACNKKCEANIVQLDKKKCKKKSTENNILGNQFGKSTQYLDRHKVQCDKNFVLKAFGLKRSPPKIHYEYECCPAKTKGCKSKWTKPTPYGDFGISNLSKQKVMVPNAKTFALTGFFLKVDYKKKAWNYNYSYCSVLG